MKKILLNASVLASMLFGTILSSPIVNAADTYYKDTTVTATVTSGGIDITAANVAFGNVAIGAANPTSALNLSVTNKTGSAGLTVTVADTSSVADPTGMTLTYTPTSGTALNVSSTAVQAFKTTTTTSVAQAFNGVLTGKMPTTTKTGTFNRTLHWVVNPTV